MAVTAFVFQFTPLREGRHIPVSSARGRKDFNSRPYVRGDQLLLSMLFRIMDFNSRPYVRGDQLGLLVVQLRQVFQFTPLREGRLVGDS